MNLLFSYICIAAMLCLHWEPSACTNPDALGAAARDKRHSLPGMAKFCKKREDGKLYPDPSDCQAYIYCSGGYAYRAECGKGLYYSKEKQACDYDFGACSGHKSTDSTEHSTTRRHLTSARYTRKIPDHTKSPPPAYSDTRGGNEHSDDNASNRIVKDGNILDSYCLKRKDGTHSHPDDCSSYILCSNGYSFPVTCPRGLVYVDERKGCDFDREKTCHQSAQVQLFVDISQNEADDITGGVPVLRDNIQLNNGQERHNYYCVYRCTQNNGCRFVCDSSDDGQNNGSPSDAATLETHRQNAASAMPAALEEAMSSLMKQMEIEANFASHMKDTARPFRLVQKFLNAKPIAKHMGLPAFIITNASRIMLHHMGVDIEQGIEMLASMGSPLSANVHKLNADDPQPEIEPGTCPWPKYNCAPNSKYRSFDGSCNNLNNPLWGRSLTPLVRFVKPQYGDGILALRKGQDGSELPPARLVSYSINEDRDVPQYIHTVLLLQWGQFMDHDMTLTAITKLPLDPTGHGDTIDIECGQDGCSTDLDACVPIPVGSDDPAFRGKKCLEFVRSQGVPNTDCTMGPRQQLNQQTAFLDASTVYGTSKEETERLRDMSNRNRGRLRVSRNPNGAAWKDLLPTTTEDRECNMFHQSPCFLAGDERVNEQNALTTMHTLWMRHHNYVEENLYRVNRHWDGERLFQESRKIVIATVQHIMFNEFLPIVLGPAQLDKYELRLEPKSFYNGYDSSVNPGIANAFSAAAFRFGHSLLIPTFHRLGQNYENEFSYQLSEMFFRPMRLTEKGSIDGFARGLCQSRAQTVDRFITREVTNKLFSEHPPHGLGHDLVSLNIQRARDHGVPGYNFYREWCGLGRARSFDDLVDIEPSMRMKFKSLYKHVDDIDLFPASLTESAVEGGLLGPTFSCIIGRQMRNLRKGDRYWYENAGSQGFTLEQLNEIRKMMLSKVMCTNSDGIGHIQPAAMQLPFRQAYPDDRVQGGRDGLDAKWFTQLWHSNYNARVNCSCLPDIDFYKWSE